MKVFGRKPSELRKTAVVVLGALLVLVAAVPVGLPAQLAGVIGAVGLAAKALHLYLTTPSVADLIDSTDNLE
ncbi:Uncharacterised protein [Mycobacteroides abscessus subsp. massiliense]|nr:Uncharacterised protein [Mycobacteroides abscessus subsp. abscessus]SKM68877.1 Uncharacterised protein [Mycobacteroides abscessus subsp. massiliense]SIL91210.1 Uncharacterised protein [Mycobacteroides abscessus subsp. abscessus]SKN34798.1 Uncharacterised protein [Mycobacteroides abscessus subsp. massiliense]SKP16690.1 Uncharacterised protein [Mycobacteroides abscessus subsp. massiliense]